MRTRDKKACNRNGWARGSSGYLRECKYCGRMIYMKHDYDGQWRPYASWIGDDAPEGEWTIHECQDHPVNPLSDGPNRPSRIVSVSRELISADFSSFDALHNRWIDDECGMSLICDFVINGCRGTVCEAVASFCYPDETPLRDFNGHFRNSDGEVCVAKVLLPRFDSTQYGDFRLFMPYGELHMVRGEHNLICNIALFQLGKEEMIASTNWIDFHVTAS